jgi:WD40 repeat protein
VAFSPDGRRVASAGFDRAVRVWDAETGQETHVLAGHRDMVWWVAFSPDGKYLASATFDVNALQWGPPKEVNCEVKVWDAATGREVRTLPRRFGSVKALAFAPGGPLIVASTDVLSANKEADAVTFWPPAAGPPARSVPLPPSLRVALSPEGQRLAWVGPRTASVYDLNTGKPLLALNDRPLPSVLAFSRDGQRLATTGEEGPVKVWALTAGRGGQAALLRTLGGGKDGLPCLAFSPDGTRLAAGSRNGAVRVWSAATGKALLTLKGHTKGVAGLAFSPDGARLASASVDGTVRLWGATAGPKGDRPYLQLSLPGGGRSPLWCVTFSPDSQRVAAATHNRAQVWQVSTGQEVLRLAGAGSRVAFSPDGRRLATPSGSDVVVWGAADGRPLLRLKANAFNRTCLAFSPDGQRLALSAGGGALTVWDVSKGEGDLAVPLLSLQGHTDAVVSVAFSPDGQRLASASWDKTVRVWDVATGGGAAGSPLLTLRTGEMAYAVAFSPDGRRVASTGRGETVDVWDVSAAQGELSTPVLRLKGHTGAVYGVAFSPDGRRLASAGSDKTVKVWEAATGQELLSLQGHTQLVYGVAFSPDGRRLASASSDGTVKVWDAPPEAGGRR